MNYDFNGTRSVKLSSFFHDFVSVNSLAMHAVLALGNVNNLFVCNILQRL